jgi:hypothetical protein
MKFGIRLVIITAILALICPEPIYETPQITRHDSV